MKTSFLLKWFFLTILIFLVSGCSRSRPVTQSDLIGAWYHPHPSSMSDRFGHSIFYFDWDGNLYITELDSIDIKKLHYEFVRDSEIIVTGDKILSSTMQLSITSKDNLLYCADYHNPYRTYIACWPSPEMQRLSDWDALELRAKYWGELLSQSGRKTSLTWWQVVIIVLLVLFFVGRNQR